MLVTNIQGEDVISHRAKSVLSSFIQDVQPNFSDERYRIDY
jgi:hypothetical protein